MGRHGSPGWAADATRLRHAVLPSHPRRVQVKDYVQRFAKPEDVAALEAEEQHPHGGGDDDMSDGEGGARLLLRCVGRRAGVTAVAAVLPKGVHRLSWGCQPAALLTGGALCQPPTLADGFLSSSSDEEDEQAAGKME